MLFPQYNFFFPTVQHGDPVHFYIVSDLSNVPSEQKRISCLLDFFIRVINMVYEKWLEFCEKTRSCCMFITGSSVSWFVLMFCKIPLETLILFLSPIRELPRWFSFLWFSPMPLFFTQSFSTHATNHWSVYYMFIC